MNTRCCQPVDAVPVNNRRYRRVLWVALLINAVMFLVEIVTGMIAGSVSLQADALDFLADAANYGISLFVLSAVLSFRAKASLFKGATMLLFGIWVAGSTAWHAWQGTVPDVATMGIVGLAALLANLTVLLLLWAYREGDSNMRSVWLCSRNDVIGNVAILLAALGVFGTGTGWPDVIVAAIMSVLAVHSGGTIVSLARQEMRIP